MDARARRHAGASATAVLMHRVGVAVEQAHAYRLDIELLESTHDAPHAVHVELRHDLAICANPLTQLDAQRLRGINGWYPPVSP